MLIWPNSRNGPQMDVFFWVFLFLYFAIWQANIEKSYKKKEKFVKISTMKVLHLMETQFL
jgi:hypothetical protein